MKSKYLLVAVLLGLVCIVFFTLQGGQSQEYVDQIVKERKEKDDFMRTSSESPFAGQQNSFTGLSYFVPDEKYRIVAALNPVAEKKIRTLSTSDGLEKRFREYAIAEFDLDSRKNKLIILESMEMGANRGMLFLPFGDETSAGETYGGGRYLDLKKIPKGSKTITLDFNQAYNPYCAYSEKYSCPLPPSENLLSVAIKAGEKVYIDH